MKKLIAILLLTVMSTSAFACPHGKHIEGGEGSHHRGGHCVANEQ